jgi:hypothetical protein
MPSTGPSSKPSTQRPGSRLHRHETTHHLRPKFCPGLCLNLSTHPDHHTTGYNDLPFLRSSRSSR